MNNKTSRRVIELERLLSDALWLLEGNGLGDGDIGKAIRNAGISSEHRSSD